MCSKGDISFQVKGGGLHTSLSNRFIFSDRTTECYEAVVFNGSISGFHPAGDGSSPSGLS